MLFQVQSTGKVKTRHSSSITSKSLSHCHYIQHCKRTGRKWRWMNQESRNYSWQSSKWNSFILKGRCHSYEYKYRYGKNQESRNKIVHDSMSLTDTDTVTDSDTETFILIGPSSDLCCIVQVNGWTSPSYASLFVPFLAYSFLPVQSTRDPAMPEISKIMKGWTEQLIALVQENVALYDQSADDYCTSSSLKQTSNNGFEWTDAMTDTEKKGGKCTALWLDKYDQKRPQSGMPLQANHVYTQSVFRTPYPYLYPYKWTRAFACPRIHRENLWILTAVVYKQRGPEFLHRQYVTTGCTSSMTQHIYCGVSSTHSSW